MGYKEGEDLALNFMYPFQHFNRIKNHWRQADPVAALTDAQPGMIASDSADDKLYHFGAAAAAEEILQATRSIDVIPYFLGVDLWSSSYHHIIRASEAEGLAGADLRIGLDETMRSLIICDRGDIATDFGLAAVGDPTLNIRNAAGSGWATLTSTVLSLNSGNLQLYASQALTWGGFEFNERNDKSSGNLWRFVSSANIELTDADAEQAWMYIEPKINQTLTAGYIGILLDVTETSLGDASAGAGYNALMDLRVATVTQFGIQNDGKIMTNQAIPCPSGGCTPGTIIQEMPIYDGSGNLLGYLPIYDAL